MARTEVAPAFQVYVNDAISDAAAMSIDQFGIYCLLAMHAWREHGVSTNAGELARLVGMTKKRFDAASPAVLPAFEQRGDRLVLPWQELQRAKYTAFRKQQQANSRKRWDSIARPENSRAPNANGFPAESSVAVSVPIPVTVTETEQSSSSVDVDGEYKELSSLIPVEYRADLDALLGLVKPVGARVVWVRLIRGYTAGLGGRPIPQFALGRAIRAYLANGESPNVKLFQGYVRREGPRPPREGRDSWRNGGEEGFANGIPE